MIRSNTVTLTCVCSLAFICTASASQLAIFNTGESTGGTALPVGTADPNYTLISAPSGVPLTAIATTPFPTWAANTATADWISPGSTGQTSWPGGNYDYQTSFSLMGLDPATAQLSGSWTSDNNACIFLNGANTGDCTTFAGFGSLTAFSITSGFIAGTNTLDFVVTNGSSSPSGVFAEISGSATSGISGVPEPPSLPLLLGIGLLGVAAMLHSTRKLRD